MVDIQGVGFQLCDPEIASQSLKDETDSILFCTGNLSIFAIKGFKRNHVCSIYCDMLKLPDLPEDEESNAG